MQLSETITYYDEHAEAFLASTAEADMSVIRGKFLSTISEGSQVLDWGCGSGRDAKAMLDAGYGVVAVDASERMCAATHNLTGLTVRHERFGALSAEAEYDGVWANASLLHVPRTQLPDVFGKVATALKPGGAFYCSFKFGDFEGMRNGRWFTDLTRGLLGILLAKEPRFHDACQWITRDVRRERNAERWLNCLTFRR